VLFVSKNSYKPRKLFMNSYTHVSLPSASPEQLMVERAAAPIRFTYMAMPGSSDKIYTGKFTVMYIGN
jgi:hypothetical protein